MIPGVWFLVLTGFGPHDVSLQSTTSMSAFPCLMVAVMTMVAVNLAVRRGTRHGTAELYGSTPMSAAARTGAHLLSVAWPATATAVFLLLQVAYWRFLHGGYGSFSAAELAVGPVLVLGAGALAVLVTRVWPNILVIPVTCAGIVAIELFAASPQAAVSGAKHLAFWVSPELTSLLPPRPAAAHLVYLLGLTALAAATAVFIDRRRRAVAGVAILAAVVIVTAGIVQLRSVSPSAWAVVDRHLAQPDDGQVCEVRHGVRYCAFAEDFGAIPVWARAVAGVQRAVPPGRFPADLVVSERESLVGLQYVNPSGRARLAARLPHLDDLKPVDDGRLHPSPDFAWEQLSSLDLAADTAARTVGLPLAPGPTGELCDATGQGRAVVALWLAGQSMPRAGRELERLATESVSAIGDRRYVLLTDSTVVYGGVAWGEPEVALALALLHRPPGQVAADVGRQWAVLTDPGTTTDAVAPALGLDPAARLPAPTVELPERSPQTAPNAVSGPCP